MVLQPVQGMLLSKVTHHSKVNQPVQGQYTLAATFMSYLWLLLGAHKQAQQTHPLGLFALEQICPLCDEPRHSPEGPCAGCQVLDGLTFMLNQGFFLDRHDLSCNPLPSLPIIYLCSLSLCSFDLCRGCSICSKSCIYLMGPLLFTSPISFCKEVCMF